MTGLFHEALSSPLAYVRRDGLEALKYYFEASGRLPHREIRSLLIAAKADRNGMIRQLAESILEQLGAQGWDDGPQVDGAAGSAVPVNAVPNPGATPIEASLPGSPH